MMTGFTTPALLALMAPAAGGQNNVYAPIFMYGAIFAIFYFVLIRPQSQQRKKHEETIRALKRGDEVVTAGGVVGEVVAIKQLSADVASAEDRVTIKSGDTRMIVERGRITRIAGAASAPPTA
jgi:preprotein translocase subunit YajC